MAPGSVVKCKSLHLIPDFESEPLCGHSSLGPITCILFENHRDKIFCFYKDPGKEALGK